MWSEDVFVMRRLNPTQNNDFPPQIFTVVSSRSDMLKPNLFQNLSHDPKATLVRPGFLGTNKIHTFVSKLLVLCF